jgi:two-component system KDP operon response regulator KdpE
MTEAPLILLVDDDRSIQRAMTALLRSHGYAVVTTATGRDAISIFDRERPHLVILDLGLPDEDGIEVCRQLRARSDTPIVILSVRGAEVSKVAALDAGADDYVTKPFGPEELLARVRAGLRRSMGRDEAFRGVIRRGDLSIDFDRRRVLRGTTEIRLTPKEFKLLTVLAAHEGRVLTHRTIFKAIWGTATSDQQEHLRVLVNQLRKKIEVDPAHPRYVLTEPWVGYRFAEEES